MIKLQGRSQIICGDEVLEVSRSAVIYVDGKPTINGSKSFKIPANVQPLGGRELLLVPEGDRTKEQYFIYTPTAVQTADLVARSGVNFQVQEVNEWGSYYQARIMRIDAGPDASF